MGLGARREDKQAFIKQLQTLEQTEALPSEASTETEKRTYRGLKRGGLIGAGALILLHFLLFLIKFSQAGRDGDDYHRYLVARLLGNGVNAFFSGAILGGFLGGVLAQIEERRKTLRYGLRMAISVALVVTYIAQNTPDSPGFWFSLSLGLYAGATSMLIAWWVSPENRD